MIYEQNQYATNIQVPKKYYRVPIEKDIQTILTVLGRRNRKLEKDLNSGRNLEELILDLNNAIAENKEDKIKTINKILDTIPRIDLSETNLYKADLSYLHFENANITRSHFVKSDCNYSHFENSKCSFLNIVENSKFGYAFFQNSKINYANFNDVFCAESLFDYSFSGNSNYANVYYHKTSFIHADLRNSTFKNSQLFDTNFKNAFCRETNFKDASGITSKQLAEAKTLYETQGINEKMEEEIKQINPTLFDEPV